jgi:Flp pilus assembly protein TadG
MSFAGRTRIFAEDRKGATAVEFALVGMPFLGLLLIALQLGIIYVSQSALELATEKSARLVLTGTVQGQAQTQSQFLATVCGKLPAMLKCANLMVDAQVYTSFSGANTTTPTITYDSHGNVTNTWNYNIGGAGDIVVLRVIYLMPVIGGPLFALANSNGARVLMATSVFKNEPYQ